MSEKRHGIKRRLLYRLGEFSIKGDSGEQAAEMSGLSVKTRRNLSLLAVFFMVAILITSAINRLVQQEKAKSVPARQIESLQAQLKEAKHLNELLLIENEALSAEFNRTRNEIFEKLSETTPENQVLLQEYQAASVMAGMTNYDGPGLRVVLRDKEGIRYDQSTSASEIVHDADIRYIVDWFKRNYADAIAVNGERLSPMSPLLCTGPSVLVNRVYQSSPFVIEAGCNAEALLPLLTESTGVKLLLERGIRVDISLDPTLHVPSQQDLVYVDVQVNKLGGAK